MPPATLSHEYAHGRPGSYGTTAPIAPHRYSIAAVNSSGVMNGGAHSSGSADAAAGGDASPRDHQGLVTSPGGAAAAAAAARAAGAAAGGGGILNLQSSFVQHAYMVSMPSASAARHHHHQQQHALWRHVSLPAVGYPVVPRTQFVPIQHVEQGVDLQGPPSMQMQMQMQMQMHAEAAAHAAGHGSPWPPLPSNMYFSGAPVPSQGWSPIPPPQAPPRHHVAHQQWQSQPLWRGMSVDSAGVVCASMLGAQGATTTHGSVGHTGAPGFSHPVQHGEVLYASSAQMPLHAGLVQNAACPAASWGMHATPYSSMQSTHGPISMSAAATAAATAVVDANVNLHRSASAAALPRHSMLQPMASEPAMMMMSAGGMHVMRSTNPRARQVVWITAAPASSGTASDGGSSIDDGSSDPTEPYSGIDEGPGSSIGSSNATEAAAANAIVSSGGSMQTHYLPAASQYASSATHMHHAPMQPSLLRGASLPATAGMHPATASRIWRHGSMRMAPLAEEGSSHASGASPMHAMADADAYLHSNADADAAPSSTSLHAEWVQSIMHAPQTRHTNARGDYAYALEHAHAQYHVNMAQAAERTRGSVLSSPLPPGTPIPSRTFPATTAHTSPTACSDTTARASESPTDSLRSSTASSYTPGVLTQPPVAAATPDATHHASPADGVYPARGGGPGHGQQHGHVAGSGALQMPSALGRSVSDAAAVMSGRPGGGWPRHWPWQRQMQHASRELAAAAGAATGPHLAASSMTGASNMSPPPALTQTPTALQRIRRWLPRRTPTTQQHVVAVSRALPAAASGQPSSSTLQRSVSLPAARACGRALLHTSGDGIYSGNVSVHLDTPSAVPLPHGPHADGTTGDADSASIATNALTGEVSFRDLVAAAGSTTASQGAYQQATAAEEDEAAASNSLPAGVCVAAAALGSMSLPPHASSITLDMLALHALEMQQPSSRQFSPAQSQATAHARSASSPEAGPSRVLSPDSQAGHSDSHAASASASASEGRCDPCDRRLTDSPRVSEAGVEEPTGSDSGRLPVTGTPEASSSPPPPPSPACTMPLPTPQPQPVLPPARTALPQATTALPQARTAPEAPRRLPEEHGPAGHAPAPSPARSIELTHMTSPLSAAIATGHAALMDDPQVSPDPYAPLPTGPAGSMSDWSGTVLGVALPGVALSVGSGSRPPSRTMSGTSSPSSSTNGGLGRRNGSGADPASRRRVSPAASSTSSSRTSGWQHAVQLFSRHAWPHAPARGATATATAAAVATHTAHSHAAVTLAPPSQSAAEAAVPDTGVPHAPQQQQLPVPAWQAWLARQHPSFPWYLLLAGMLCPPLWLVVMMLPLAVDHACAVASLHEETAVGRRIAEVAAMVHADDGIHDRINGTSRGSVGQHSPYMPAVALAHAAAANASLSVRSGAAEQASASSVAQQQGAAMQHPAPTVAGAASLAHAHAAASGMADPAAGLPDPAAEPAPSGSTLPIHPAVIAAASTAGIRVGTQPAAPHRHSTINANVHLHGGAMPDRDAASGVVGRIILVEPPAATGVPAEGLTRVSLGPLWSAASDARQRRHTLRHAAFAAALCAVAFTLIGILLAVLAAVMSPLLSQW